MNPATSILLAVLAAAMWRTVAFAQADDAITPYRPSVSSPAQLPVPGQLELELGAVRQRSNGLRRDAVPYQFKLAFSRQWGVLVGGEARVDAREGAARARGAGDTSVIVKRAWELDGSAAAGIEMGVKLPTAPDALGSGKADGTVNAIYSRDLGAVHVDANLNGTRLGAVDPGTGRMQTGVSISLSAPLSQRWGAIVEASGTRRHGAERAAQLLGAVSFSPTPRLTFDAGIVRAAHPAPRSRSVFAGVVFPVARLW